MFDYATMVRQLMMQAQPVADTGSPIKQKLSPYGLTEGARGYAGGYGSAPITPRVMNSLEKRLRNSGDDEELARIVRDAGRYGLDWTYMLAK